VELTRNGHPDAYDELVARYQNTVRSRAFSVLTDYQAAEDVAQESFIKAYSALGTLAEPDRFGGWLLTIVQHTALDLLRSRKDNPSLENMREQGFEAPRPTRGLQLEKIADREEEARVLEALADLRDDYREIIVLKHVEKLSYKTIADRLGMTVSSVGEKLSRVRGLLKQRIEKKQISAGEADEKPDGEEDVAR
jgi:RNA polymerase sigma-70 factor (ECF subfamily)